MDKYPADVKDVVKNFNAGKVHGKSVDVVVETEGNVTVTFTHNGGSYKLNILGVKLTDANGNLVAQKYHHGKAGNSLVDNVYDLGTVAAGTYTLHSYVWNFDGTGGENDKVEMAQGYITVAGATGVKGLTNTGTENTKWIVEEIKEPETTVYYNVPSLSSATYPDGKAYASLYLGFDAQIPGGITAWIVKGVFENNLLDMLEVDGGIVPANTGLILSSESPMTNQKFYYSGAASGFDAEENIITGTAYAKIVDCRAHNVYMLGKKNDRIALYWTYENRNATGEKETVGGTTNHNESGYVMCNANKSYLLEETPNENAVSLYGLSFSGNTTVVDEVKGEGDDVKAIYDLAGRRLVRIASPGIYIVDGKKVYVTDVEE